MRNVCVKRVRGAVALGLALGLVGGCSSHKDQPAGGTRAASATSPAESSPAAAQPAISPAPVVEPPPATESVDGWMLEGAFEKKADWVDDTAHAFEDPYSARYGGERTPIWTDAGPWVFEEIPPRCPETAPSQNWAAYQIWIQKRTESVYLVGDQRSTVEATGPVVVVPHRDARGRCGSDKVATRWIPVRFTGQPWKNPPAATPAPGGAK